MASGESVKSPLSHRIARVVTKIVVVICLLLAVMIFAGTYLGKKDIDERPLQVGEAVSVKNVGKGSRPGFIRAISADGKYVVAMGETKDIAARPSTDVLKLDGTGRLKRRKEDTQ
jgi:hypothetical protein